MIPILGSPAGNREKRSHNRKICSHWAWKHGRPQKFFHGGGATSTFCLPFLGFWRCIANGCLRNALFFLLKENSPCYGNSQKMRFVGSNSQVYYDNLYNSLYADFQSRALLYKEALPWSLMKPQILTLFILRESSASLPNKNCKRLGAHSQIRIKP